MITVTRRELHITCTCHTTLAMTAYAPSRSCSSSHDERTPRHMSHDERTPRHMSHDERTPRHMSHDERTPRHMSHDELTHVTRHMTAHVLSTSCCFSCRLGPAKSGLLPPASKPVRPCDADAGGAVCLEVTPAQSRVQPMQPTTVVR